MRGSMKLKKRGQGVWKAFLVESLIFIGLGVLILVNPFSEIRMTVQISGCIFVANGVLGYYFLSDSETWAEKKRFRMDQLVMERKRIK